METCKRLVENERLNLNEATRLSPVKILSRAYNELLDDKNGLIGSSTACIVVFNRDASLVHAANLGDSGFVIIRDNKIIHRSQEQQHYFNSPYQLAIHPNLHMSENNEDSMISDQ
jgi:protein phosphatase PTC7